MNFYFAIPSFSARPSLLAPSVEYGFHETVTYEARLRQLQFLAYLLAKMEGVGGYEGWRW